MTGARAGRPAAGPQQDGTGRSSTEPDTAEQSTIDQCTAEQGMSGHGAIDQGAIGHGGSEPRLAVTRKEHALWLLERLVPDAGVNNLGIALRVDGHLQADALAEALRVVLGRYPALRTAFTAAGGELTKDVLPPDRFPVEVGPLELPAEPLPDDRLAAELGRFIARPFPLDGRPLVRAGLARRPDGDVFCLTVHHLVFDVTSATILMHTLIPVYDALAAGRPVPAAALVEVPPAPERRPDEAHLAYWREHLRDLPPGGTDLWCGAPRPQRPRLAGDIATHTLSEEGRAAVQQLQRQVRAPVAAVLLAAYHVLLAAHGAGPDLVIGSPLDLRGQQATQEVGYHVNVVPLRLRADLTAGFRALARQARDRFLGAMAHGDVSVDDLTAELPRTGAAWQTVYRHVFNYLPQVASEELVVGGTDGRLLPVENGYSKFDLEMVAVPAKAEIRLRYDRQILARPDVEALLRRYEALLVEAAAAADRPVGEYAGWSPADRETVASAHRPPTASADASPLDAVLARGRRTPGAAAVVDGDRVLDYAGLIDAAGAVRAGLAEAGAGAGDVVAVTARRPGDLAAAALGVWLAGGVCLPIGSDRGTGVRRRLDRCGARWVLAYEADPDPDGLGLPVVRLAAAGAAAAEVPAEVSAEFSADPDAAAPAGAPDRPAWLLADMDADADVDVDMDADGGTGTDPGAAGPFVPVALSHRDVMTALGHVAGELGAAPGTGTLASARPGSFQALVELFLPLTTGGRVVAAPPAGWADGPGLGEAVARHAVGIVPVPPGTPAEAVEAAVRGAADAADGLRIAVHGEDLPPAALRRLVAAGARPYSVYAAPGVGSWALSGPVESNGAGRTRGRPAPGVTAAVRAPDGRDLPVGVRGELHLAVAGAGSAWLPTGVLARWCPDGSVERLGPLGERATVAGRAVDLGAVDAALRDHPGVAAAATVGVLVPGPDAVPVSFVVPGADPAAGGDLARAARDHARDLLPEAVVPARVTCLEVLPRRPDGRFDRDALLRLAREQAGAAPGPDGGADGELVARLVEVWQRLLGTEVTADTNFFAAGGHSLLAARLAQDVEELTGAEVELAEVFDHPTPMALAARLAGARAGAETG
ncbi:putative non-ribosomal peptide synthetase [Actinacidiphila reveromycinica]|uniref:Putative non-ribosomal peptide synthetase n=1 Tax=Actinacidiphila reveromycinica TaxID=659352 RepID=A0A7U3V102_9ACTN|nr:condensation domain-containing protein [Streptomyces sp. SN-593]BBB02257.1 putative non-ribosomal peptide synthetase [Streptomyces sp. SN-593]